MSNATDEGSQTSKRGERRGAAGADGPSDARGQDRLDERLSAVERAVTGSDAAVADLGDSAAAAAEREALASRVAEVESRVEELEAATQAIRGYVGSIRAVNREVERRADLALARASGGEDAAPESERSSEAGPGDAVPSETALDAAVPADDDRRTEAPGGADRDGSREGADADGTWRDEALDRLRESL